MNDLTIYLAGACKNVPDGGKEWRLQIADKLCTVADWCDRKITIIDPTKYFSYDEKKHKSQKQIKEFYLNKISKCGIVVVNLDNTAESIGTAQEIQYAVDQDIPIIGFGTKNMYPWISEVDCQVIFDTMTEAVDYIRDYYLV